VRVHPIHLMTVERHQAKRLVLWVLVGCKSKPTIANYNYYSARKLILILLFRLCRELVFCYYLLWLQIYNCMQIHSVLFSGSIMTVIQPHQSPSIVDPALQHSLLDSQLLVQNSDLCICYCIRHPCYVLRGLPLVYHNKVRCLASWWWNTFLFSLRTWHMDWKHRHSMASHGKN